MNKTETYIMNKRILKHGENLLKIFPNTDERDPMKLCKKLFRLENKAHDLSTQYCNGDIDYDNWLDLGNQILSKVAKILGEKESFVLLNIFVNGDARGHALKMSEQFTEGKKIMSDWGGYGILAPDFRDL